MKNKIPKFNDGFVRICKPKQAQGSFNAVKNVNKQSELDFVVKLAFEEMSKRDQDIEFASSLDRTLSMKIKTRLFLNIDSTHKALIENVLYSILKIDFDKSQKLTFLYLEEERKLKDE